MRQLRQLRQCLQHQQAIHKSADLPSRPSFYAGEGENERGNARRELSYCLLIQAPRELLTQEGQRLPFLCVYAMLPSCFHSAEDQAWKLLFSHRFSYPASTHERPARLPGACQYREQPAHHRARLEANLHIRDGLIPVSEGDARA